MRRAVQLVIADLLVDISSRQKSNPEFTKVVNLAKFSQAIHNTLCSQSQMCHTRGRLDKPTVWVTVSSNAQAVITGTINGLTLTAAFHSCIRCFSCLTQSECRRILESSVALIRHDISSKHRQTDRQTSCKVISHRRSTIKGALPLEAAYSDGIVTYS